MVKVKYEHATHYFSKGCDSEYENLEKEKHERIREKEITINLYKYQNSVYILVH